MHPPPPRARPLVGRRRRKTQRSTEGGSSSGEEIGAVSAKISSTAGQSNVYFSLATGLIIMKHMQDFKEYWDEYCIPIAKV